jgi:hypothetical protein
MKLLITFLSLCALSITISGQTSIKIFDATPISASSGAAWLTGSQISGLYRTTVVNLSCPSGRKPKSTLSGPFGGQFAVDDYILVNNETMCGKGKSCFSSVYANPFYYLGMPMEVIYGQIDPIDISSQISGSGLYTFYLLDIGQLYGNTDIYLNTTCSLAGGDTNPPAIDPVPNDGATAGDSVVCHRENGNKINQTLTVGPSSIAAHLGHGDTIGACTK